VNLLSNAIKYSDSSKPTRVVDVTGDDRPGASHIVVVRDKGVGIPENALDTILRRFTLAHTTIRIS
jgi:signal transduction histidine kinase